MSFSLVEAQEEIKELKALIARLEKRIEKLEEVKK